MGMENQNEKTGNIAFDNVITSVKLLHKYIQENDDETTFSIVLGGAVTDQDKMHCINAIVGNLNNPPIFEAALQSLVNTMKQNSLITKLIFEAYHSYRTDKNVKVVKLSVDSPMEALFVLRNLLKNNSKIQNLDDLPTDMLYELIDNLPPDLKQQFLNKDTCDDPDCPACNIRRKLKRKGKYADFSDFPPFGKKHDKEEGN